MKVLLLGSGGRESALADALGRSRVVSELFCAPGNPGTDRIGEAVAVDLTDPAAVLEATRRIGIDLVVVGPEAPLVAGVGDALRAAGRLVFGPDAAAARIEGSKSHAKELMRRAGIPTARGQTFHSFDDAVAFLNEADPPYVVKADGLAAGKGVTVTRDKEDAVAALRERMVERKFGDAGASVVIEEFLDGEEASLIAFTDGRSVVACEPAQDYKRVHDGDAGPNTGGMGSYSPVPACPPDLVERIATEIIAPMVAVTAATGAPFVGALYAGLALTTDGPKVIEFNARFGDPETQALIPRFRSDLGEVCLAAAKGDLEGVKLDWAPDVCVSVVAASAGYPGPHRTGLAIEGVEDASRDALVFHAGTARRDGALVTAGGRVLALSALGPTFKVARRRVYDALSKISFPGMHARTDIGLRAEILEDDTP